jgi:predicted Zn finger-like uncharacterized protein
MSQLVACPECKKHLQVPDDLLGKKVQCPECKHTFTARSPGDEQEERKSKTSTTAATPPTSKAPEWDKKSSSSSGKNGKKRSRRDEEDDEDEDEDDDDDRPSRRRKRRRSSARGGNYVPHRGGMILAFGLIGLVGHMLIPIAPIIFAIIAWVMGNTDLAEMRAGRMDPEGEGMTQAGRIMGMISVILAIVGVIAFCGIFGCAVLLPLLMVGGAAAGGAGQPPGRRKF